MSSVRASWSFFNAAPRRVARSSPLYLRTSPSGRTFGTSVTGNYGGVIWLTGAPTMAKLEASMNKVNADPAFVALVDAGAVNLQENATQSLHYRIA